MGGWMDYGRFRDRNRLPRKPLSDQDPYPRDTEGARPTVLIAGDLNRMERDYLRPHYPAPDSGWATRPEDSDPASVCSAATGIPVEDVRKVLEHVFWGGTHKFDPDA